MRRVRNESGELLTISLSLFVGKVAFFSRARELARILDRVVEIGLRGGLAELQDTPLEIPRIQLRTPLDTTSTQSEPETTTK